MPVDCPSCRQHYLYVVQEHKYTYSVESVGFNDVVPGEQVNAEGRMYLICLGCSWRGWIDDYFEAEHGVVKLFQEVPGYDNID
jgi:hypothetical protein